MFSESITGICLAYDYLVWWLQEEVRWPGRWQSRQNSWLGAPLKMRLRMALSAQHTKTSSEPQDRSPSWESRTLLNILLSILGCVFA